MTMFYISWNHWNSKNLDFLASVQERVHEVTSATSHLVSEDLSYLKDCYIPVEVYMLLHFWMEIAGVLFLEIVVAAFDVQVAIYLEEYLLQWVKQETAYR